MPAHHAHWRWRAYRRALLPVPTFLCSAQDQLRCSQLAAVFARSARRPRRDLVGFSIECFGLSSGITSQSDRRPTSLAPVGQGVTNNSTIFGLVGANVLVASAWHQSSPASDYRRFMMATFMTSPAHLKFGLYSTLGTSSVSEVSLIQLGINMLVLASFGTEVCSNLEGRRCIGLYLVAGTLSSWAAVNSLRRAGRNKSLLLGSSGAASGIVAMGVLMNPSAIVVGIIPARAWLAGSIVFAWQPIEAVHG